MSRAKAYSASSLTVDGYPGVYAVGDVANIPADDSATLPQLGSVAQQSGRWAAENILRERYEKGTEPFRYKDKGIMFIPHYPLWSLLIIALDVAVIWALATYRTELI